MGVSITNEEYKRLVDFALYKERCMKRQFVITREDGSSAMLDIRDLDALHDVIVANPQCTYKEARSRISAQLLRIYYDSKLAGNPALVDQGRARRKAQYINDEDLREQLKRRDNLRKKREYLRKKKQDSKWVQKWEDWRVEVARRLEEKFGKVRAAEILKK